MSKELILLSWNLDAALPYLAARDPRMAAAIAEIGGILRSPTDDVFLGLVQSIIGQQISLRAADTVYRRLQSALGEIMPETLCAASLDALCACGMSRRKAEYLSGAAQAVASGSLNLHELASSDDEACIRALTALRGVGRWTAEMLLIFSLGRPDVMSYDDYGLRSGLCRLYHHQSMPRERFERYRRRFSPYGTAACLVLWEIAGGRAPYACALPVGRQKNSGS